ncbi:MAG: hypothetical protein GY822_16065 [Deltaproteobacteria bacterium]|nr:hypothetical protein [Deltaproteobacteria bacterium]
MHRLIIRFPEHRAYQAQVINPHEHRCTTAETESPENDQCTAPDAPAPENYSQECSTDDCSLVVAPYCEQSCGGCGDAVVANDERSRFIEDHALGNYVALSGVACGACNCIEVSCVQGLCMSDE